MRPETMVPDSTKSAVKEESLGREGDPKGSPKSLVLPQQEKFQVPPATPGALRYEVGPRDHQQFAQMGLSLL